MCRWNQNYNELWKDKDLNTDRFMPPALFNKVLRKMDEYGKGQDFHNRFWVTHWRWELQALRPRALGTKVRWCGAALEPELVKGNFTQEGTGRQ